MKMYACYSLFVIMLRKMSSWIDFCLISWLCQSKLYRRTYFSIWPRKKEACLSHPLLWPSCVGLIRKRAKILSQKATRKRWIGYGSHHLFFFILLVWPFSGSVGARLLYWLRYRSTSSVYLPLRLFTTGISLIKRIKRTGYGNSFSGL